jgi:hypothetical protein
MDSYDILSRQISRVHDREEDMQEVTTEFGHTYKLYKHSELEPRCDPVLVVLDNQLLAIGGTEGDSEYGESHNRAFLWQPGQKGDKGTWRRIADLPEARSEHCAAAHNGQLIVAGGVDCVDQGGGCADIETSAAFNGQTWTSDGTLGMFTGAMSVGTNKLRKLFSFQGELYAMLCMHESDHSMAEENDGSPHLSRRDGITGLWERVASLAAPEVYLLDAFVMDGKLFFFSKFVGDPHVNVEWDSYDFESGALASASMSCEARAVPNFDDDDPYNGRECGVWPPHVFLHAHVFNRMSFSSIF